jgi:hypothetical protein
MKSKLLYVAAIVIVLAVAAPLLFSQAARAPQNTTDYLVFQIFTGTSESTAIGHNFPAPSRDTAASVSNLVSAIGTVGSKTRKVGFIVGPLAFDETDDQIRQLMRDSFAIALQNNVAVGFHIDDSMFWGRLAYLNNPKDIEWLDWNKTPNTGRKLDWSLTPTKIMPQLCVNSSDVRTEVAKRAALIGEEVKRGMEALQKAGKPELFAGVIAGWETRMGWDFDTGKALGYCALANKGYSASNPPKDIDQARVDVMKEFVDFWTKSLADGGVPDEKIFSHIAFESKGLFDAKRSADPNKAPSVSYFETITFTPPSVAFGPHHYAGFSTYSEPGKLEEIQAEDAKNGNQPWASSEGTAGDPGAILHGNGGNSMESYVGSMFNHGAVLVNVFGWGVGQESNPYRKIVESQTSIEAYQKFLSGGTLQEGPQPQVPSPEFFSKMHKLQRELPPYLSKTGDPGKVGDLNKTLQQDLGAQRYTDAEKTIDAILLIIEK